MTGQTLSGLDRIPKRLLTHLGEQLYVAAVDLATLRALYRRQRTRFEHQNWAIEVTSFQDYTRNIGEVVSRELVSEALSGFDIARLASVIRESLCRRRVLIPSRRAVLDLARRLHSDVQTSIGRYLCEAIPENVRMAWLAAVTGVRGGRVLLLDSLDTVPTKVTPRAIEQQLERVRQLHRLGVKRYDLSGLSQPLVRTWARQLKYRRPARFRGLTEPRRTLEVVGYMTYQLQSHTDRLIRMIDKELVRIGTHAARDATVARQQIALRALSTLADIRMAAEDLYEPREARLRMIQERLSGFSAIDPCHLRTRASLQRYLLASRHSAIPKLLACLSELQPSQLYRSGATPGVGFGRRHEAEGCVRPSGGHKNRDSEALEAAGGDRWPGRASSRASSHRFRGPQGTPTRQHRLPGESCVPRPFGGARVRAYAARPEKRMCRRRSISRCVVGASGRWSRCGVWCDRVR